MANNNDLPKLKHFDGTSFLSQEEIQNMGFASVGSKVHISRKASFYSPQNIHIGENVRVDDFCLLIWRNYDWVEYSYCCVFLLNGPKRHSTS